MEAEQREALFFNTFTVHQWITWSTMFYEGEQESASLGKLLFTLYLLLKNEGWNFNNVMIDNNDFGFCFRYLVRM